ncbi:MAG: histidine phosphatase family protein [Desulfobacteraceae bacterium]|nr:histidine phosphatase family protein [Desulfobacteraceae bacterium]
MSVLYLIRHGQACFGTDTYDQLSDIGRHQSRVLAADLMRAGIRFDACWSGTLKRQLQTVDQVRSTFREKGLDLPDSTGISGFNEYDAQKIFRAVIPLILDEDSEFIHHVNTMHTDHRTFQRVFERAATRWASGRDSLDEALTWSTFAMRVTNSIRKIINHSGRGRHVAVFTSAGPIAVAMGNVLGLSADKTVTVSWQIVNSSVTRFKFSRGRISLATFNEYGHLERNGEKSLVTYR